jgi:hypothetical protein
VVQFFEACAEADDLLETLLKFALARVVVVVVIALIVFVKSTRNNNNNTFLL